MRDYIYRATFSGRNGIYQDNVQTTEYEIASAGYSDAVTNPDLVTATFEILGPEGSIDFEVFRGPKCEKPRKRTRRQRRLTA